MKRVLVIGDVIADVYRECTFRKMCPDAPAVRAMVEYGRDVRVGGAGNVALNVAALAPNIMVDLIGVVDSDLARIVKFTSHSRVCLESAVIEPAEVIRKERVLCDGELVARVDNTHVVSVYAAEEIERALRSYLASTDPDLVVLSDYGAGSVSESTLQMLLGMRDRLLVDTKRDDLSVFDGCLVIKLNKSELHKVLETEAAPERFCAALVTTLGEDGAMLHVRRPHPHPRAPVGSSLTYTFGVKALVGRADVVDVCGCGDTFLAGMAASLLANDDFYSAVQFGNAASATVVTEARTAVADLTRTLGLLGRGEG